MDKPKYASVDDLQAQTTLQEAAAKCGVTVEVQGSGRQVRLDCLFGCPGDHAGKREISVDTGNPQKVFACHAYQCQFRGNLLTLMHGWLTGTRPTSDRLKGEEFKRVRGVLTGSPTPPPSNVSQLPKPAAEQRTVEPPRNIPLAENANEKARELQTLDEKFIRDVAHMPPSAAAYVRRHPCLSLASMQKWRVGVLPQDTGSDKRGWSVRGQLLYPILSEGGKILAWVARDPQFEAKKQAFNALPPADRAKEKEPAKHRFPVGFHRGLELFGQHASRLDEPGYREAIARHGIIVVEGFNDVLGLDAIGVPAVAIMSNKITDEQVAKVERWARSLAGGKVTLLFDGDDAGDAGAKEALWLFAQRRLDVLLGWSQAMHGGKFKGRQPESLTRDECMRQNRIRFKRNRELMKKVANWLAADGDRIDCMGVIGEYGELVLKPSRQEWQKFSEAVDESLEASGDDENEVILSDQYRLSMWEIVIRIEEKRYTIKLPLGARMAGVVPSRGESAIIYARAGALSIWTRSRWMKRCRDAAQEFLSSEDGLEE